jgi:hypothetical protein
MKVGEMFDYFETLLETFPAHQPKHTDEISYSESASKTLHLYA